MVTIIGVRFRKSGKAYYFDPAGNEVKKGDHVIVETSRGVEYGLVVLAPKEVPEEKVVKPLKPIIRLATPEDDISNDNNEIEEGIAFDICLEKIQNHGLEMKLIDSEYTFDKNKLLFYFTADGRIDFRELVKDLAAVFRTRIELRQIGVRDETKLIGGIAICGRPLCCHTFLADFAPVSIKMAKEQNLSLNPTKISGSCGRLMCCLKNEEEAYEHLNSTLPRVGAAVTTYNGYKGYVHSISVLKQKVKVLICKANDEKELREYAVNELRFDNQNRLSGAPVGQALPDEELDENALKELEQLEQKDLEDSAEDSDQNAKSGKNYQGKKRGGGRNGRRDYRSRNGGRYSDQDNSHFESSRRDEGRNSGHYDKSGQNEGRNDGRYDRAGRNEDRSDGRYDRAGRNEGRSDGRYDRPGRSDSHFGQDSRKENRKDYRKNRKNTSDRHNDYKKKQGENPYEEQGEGRNESRNHKARYRNSHNSHKGNRSQGRR